MPFPVLCLVALLLAGTAAPQESTGKVSKRPPSSRRRSSSPAPARNGKVEIIGSGSDTPKGTIDKPLLPIAFLGNNLGIRSGTPIQVRLSKTVDSARARNGDMLEGTLAEPLANLPAGTPVRLTVVQASKAGALLSFGELSLQIVSIGGHAILSDTISAQGEEGKKEQADSAPARGTEAVFSADQVISLPAA